MPDRSANLCLARINFPCAPRFSELKVHAGRGIRRFIWSVLARSSKQQGQQSHLSKPCRLKLRSAGIAASSWRHAPGGDAEGPCCSSTYIRVYAAHSSTRLRRLQQQIAPGAAGPSWMLEASAGAAAMSCVSTLCHSSHSCWKRDCLLPVAVAVAGMPVTEPAPAAPQDCR